MDCLKERDMLIAAARNSSRTGWAASPIVLALNNASVVVAQLSSIRLARACPVRCRLCMWLIWPFLIAGQTSVSVRTFGQHRHVNELG